MNNNRRWGNRYFQTAFPITARPDFGDSNREHRSDRTVDDRTRWTSGRVNHDDLMRAARAGGGSDDRQASRYGPTRPGRILFVHGLGPLPVNCDRVFNLFCLYGNVNMVKVILDDKVLVEMDDVEAAKRCLIHLNHLPLADGHTMKVKYSKHSFIHDQIVFNKLPDGTPAQKDYSTSKLNRFTGNEMCYDRSRVAPPSKILHFFNAPTDVCGLTVHKTVMDAIGHADAISSITILPMKQGAKCSTGLIELKNTALAARTVLMSNHMTMKSAKSKFPFLTKLCFSKWSDIQQTPVVDSAATLRFSSSPRIPWMLHKSEHAIPATEFPISERTVVTGGSGGSGDSPWTLWALKGEELAAAPWPRSAKRIAAGVTTPVSDAVGHDAERQQQQRQIRQRVVPDKKYSVNYLLDMLRSRLCQNGAAAGNGGDDQTGVTEDAAGAVENDPPSSSCAGAAQNDPPSSTHDGADATAGSPPF